MQSPPSPPAQSTPLPNEEEATPSNAVSASRERSAAVGDDGEAEAEAEAEGGRGRGAGWLVVVGLDCGVRQCQARSEHAAAGSSTLTIVSVCEEGMGRQKKKRARRKGGANGGAAACAFSASRGIRLFLGRGYRGPLVLGSRICVVDEVMVWACLSAHLDHPRPGIGEPGGCERRGHGLLEGHHHQPFETKAPHRPRPASKIIYGPAVGEENLL